MVYIVLWNSWWFILFYENFLLLCLFCCFVFLLYLWWLIWLFCILLRLFGIVIFVRYWGSVVCILLVCLFWEVLVFFVVWFFWYWCGYCFKILLIYSIYFVFCCWCFWLALRMILFLFCFRLNLLYSFL